MHSVIRSETPSDSNAACTGNALTAVPRAGNAAEKLQKVSYTHRRVCPQKP